MEQLTGFLDRNSSGRNVLVLLVLTYIVYAIMLVVTIPSTMSYSGGMKLLDMMPSGYDLDYVTKLFSSLGKEGRSVYLTNQIPVDMIYPFLFGLSSCLLIAYFLKKLKKLISPYIFLSLLPLVAGIADYLENLGIIAMLRSYPDLSQSSVSTTNVFSIVKSISTSLFFISLIIILIVVAIKSLKKSRKEQNQAG